MEYSCKLGAANKLKTACLVVGVFKGNRLSALGSGLDEALNGQIQGILKIGRASCRERV